MFIILILLILSLNSLDVYASDYYAEVESLDEAKEIDEDSLKSYKHGIAIYDDNIDNKLNKDYIAYPCEVPPYQNSEYYRQGYYYKEIEFNNIYLNDITGKGAVVAIIDCGCDVSHADLRDNIIGCYNVTDIGNPNDVTDYDGHGTSVAGVIAGEDNNIGILGIAPDAKLYIIKASRGKSPYFFYSDIIRGINKCIELGNVDVINLSLGGPSPANILKNAIEKAREHGILVVCAAGNEKSSTPCYPAALQIGLSVAASNGDQLTSYSNFGVNSNIVAPGTVYTTDVNNAYTYNIGTSFASPIVAGAGALIYGANPRMTRTSSTADYVKNIILSNTDNKVYYSNSGGYVKGKLNLQNIFKVNYISSPKSPKVIIKENSQTKQQIITIKSKNNISVYYSVNNEYPFKKLTNKVRLDKKGTYKISFMAVKDGTRAYSNMITEKVIVSKKVYSQDYLKSMELKTKKKKMKSNTTQQIKIKTSGKKIDMTRVKWISSNSKIAKINNKGVITISSNAPKGKKVTFTAKVGNIKKTIDIIIK